MMTRPALAKDVGVDKDGDGFSAVVFNCEVASRAMVDNLLAAAAAACGQVADAATERDGSYSGHSDGFVWKMAVA